MGTAVAASFLAGWAMGCDEALPPRLEDPNALVLTTSMDDGPCLINHGVPTGAGEIRVEFKNIYPEVVQDSVLIHVKCDVWLEETPNVRAHVEFGQNALEDPRIISNGLLTLLPNRLARMHYQWSHRTADSTAFWESLEYVDKYTTLGEHYRETTPVRMTMEGTVQIFRKVPAYKIPRTTVTIYYQIW